MKIEYNYRKLEEDLILNDGSFAPAKMALMGDDDKQAEESHPME